MVLAGLGHVGQAFVSLLQEKTELLRSRFGLDLPLKAALRSAGGLVWPSGLRQDQLSGISAEHTSASPHWQPGLSVPHVLKSLTPGVFVDCTPSNIRSGEPGLDYTRAALRSGWHVVTANKGPLVVDFRRLSNLARKNGVSLKFSAAAGAALPALDIGLHSLAGAEILSIEGILNGTTNFILTRMEEGVPYEEALREAQTKGIAEPNPELDVDGWDAAVKLLLIANSVLGIDLRLRDMKVRGISRISPGLLLRAKQEGRSLKLIAKIKRSRGFWRATVSPEIIDQSHPLFGVNGTNKGIAFLTDTMGSITVTGGKSDPRGAAAALLKDIIDIWA